MADTRRLLVIVGRDEIDLWRYLVEDFTACEAVEVRLDQRRGERRGWGPGRTIRIDAGSTVALRQA